jgi:hypothetical protein
LTFAADTNCRRRRPSLHFRSDPSHAPGACVRGYRDVGVVVQARVVANI